MEFLPGGKPPGSGLLQGLLVSAQQRRRRHQVSLPPPMSHAQNGRIAVEPHTCRSADENDRRIRISGERICDLVTAATRAGGEQCCDVTFAILIGKLDHHIVDRDKATLQVVFEVF